MSMYWLSKHAHLCRTRDHIVILDLRNDRYLALTKEQDLSLASLVHGWPAPQDPRPHEHTDTTPAILETLLAKHVLTECAADGKDATPTQIQIADTALLLTSLLHTLDPTAPRPPRTTPVDIYRFLRAFLTVRHTLRNKRLEHGIAKIEQRNAGAPRGPIDPDALRVLIAKFRTIRPFVYAAKDNCLQDAFVLIEFLARYGVYPTWVFGVRTRAFFAHCWVQSGHHVLNDTPDHIGTFKPIMSV